MQVKLVLDAAAGREIPINYYYYLSSAIYKILGESSPQYSGCLNKTAIAENIKRYRNKLGIWQDRLSLLADVTYNSIIKIESGANKNPTIETLSKIAKALGVGVNNFKN